LHIFPRARSLDDAARRGAPPSEEGSNALDDLRDPARDVAARAGEPYTLGGFIHVLLLLAIGVVLIESSRVDGRFDRR
jgi:hypothetical protein